MRPASQFPIAIISGYISVDQTTTHRNQARETEMDAAGAQTLPAIVSTLNPSESLAKRSPGESSAGAETPLAIALRPFAFREDENGKLIDFIRPDGVTSSSQRSDETIRHEQDGLPHKSDLQPAVKGSK
jgi:hypothetical protein